MQSLPTEKLKTLIWGHLTNENVFPYVIKK